MTSSLFIQHFRNRLENINKIVYYTTVNRGSYHFQPATNFVSPQNCLSKSRVSIKPDIYPSVASDQTHPGQNELRNFLSTIRKRRITKVYPVQKDELNIFIWSSGHLYSPLYYSSSLLRSQFTPAIKERGPANHVSLVQWRLYLLYVKPALANIYMLPTPGLNTDQVERYPA